MSGYNLVSEAVKHGHRELEDFYNHITKSDSHEEITRYRHLFIWELARHCIGEELVVHPAIEQHVSDGKAMADKDREDMQKVTQLLLDFEKLKSTDEDFRPMVESLFAHFGEHVKEEEHRYLNALESSIGSGDSGQLARCFERTKHFVPTHAHPNNTESPPFETVTELLTVPLDKLADLFKAYP